MNAINSVGIDVSKGKSMVAILRPMGEVVMLPKEYPHTFQHKLREFHQLHLVGTLGAGVEHMGLVLAEFPQGFRLAHTPPAIQHDQLAPVLLVFIL